MGLNLIQQPTNVETDTREEDFLREVSNLPNEQQTWSNWLFAAEKHGAKDPVKAAMFWSKEYKNQLARQKEIKNLTKEVSPDTTLPIPPGQTPATPVGVETLQKAGLPITGLTTPFPLSQPFGQIEGRPATLQDIEDITGKLPLRQTTPFQPELGVFGQGALEALPQTVDTTKTIPITMITQAAEALTRAKAPTEKEERFGNDREALARELAGTSFLQAPQKIKALINKMVRKNEGFRLEVDKDGNVVVTQGNLGQPTMSTKTYAQQVVMNSMQTKQLLSQLRPLINSQTVGLVAQLQKKFFGVKGQTTALWQWMKGQQQELLADAMAGGVDPKDPIDIKKTFLDPKIPMIEMLANILTYKLAKLLDRSGRVAKDDFENQKRALGLHALLATPEDIFPRLDLYDQMLDSAIQGAKMALKGDFSGTATVKPKIIDWEDIK